MEYDLSYDDSPSLKQTLADLLRGMSKKQAYQELGQGIQNTAKVIPSVVESLGRGAIAQMPGTFGDISELARQFAPETMQSVMGNRVAPTTEEILAKIPRLNPDYQGSSQHETIGGLISPAMPSLLRAGAKATQNMPIGNMIAYHGTPHEIKGAFDISKVGTGEGAQAYGHGMYFAENPKVAQAYQENLSGKFKPVGSEDLPEKAWDEIGQVMQKHNIAGDIPVGMSEAKHVRMMLNNYRDKLNPNEIKTLEKWAATPEGNLYKVDIPDAYVPTMMDYDKPLGQQSAIVKKALNEIKKQITPEMKMELGGDMNLLFGKDITPVQFLNTMEIIHPTGGVGIGEKMLNELGVKGMRYLDATSRDTGKGTSNFVVFDPKEVKILEKNGKPSRKDILEEQLNNIKK